MSKILEVLKGKRTILVGLAMFVIAGLHAVRSLIPLLQNVPEDYFQRAMELAKSFLVDDGGGLGLGMIFLRLAMADKK